MNYRTVMSILGRILLIEAGLLLVPTAVAAMYGEALSPFLWTILISAAAGGLLLLIGQGDGDIRAREGFVSVALSWIVISLAGALPFVFSGTIPDYIDALFETVSGFTTTGASILPEVESLPRGILFWRCFTHWIGGMGVLVFMMAVMPMDDEHSLHLLRAEVTGPVKGKLVPRMRSTARILYLIYIGLSVILTAFLLLGRMSLYDAILTAFGTASTGGFGIRNASIGAFNSAYIEMVVAVFMLLFGINFNLFYIVLLRRSLKGFKSEELAWYGAIVLFATVTIALSILPRYGTMLQSLRYSFFQVSTIITSTGFGTADFCQWPEYARIMLVSLMIVGGCAGSTAGGTKVARLVIVLKTAWSELRRLVFPRSVSRVTLDGERLEERTIRNTMVYMLLYALLVIAACLVLSLDGLDFETTLTSVISMLSNIGPGLGLVGPAGSYAVWSAPATLLLSLLMLLGRLEIFPILMLFAPGIWVGRKKT